MSQPANATELLTPDEVATRLKIHPDTARKMLRVGSLPGIKIGASWRTPSDVLEKWISEQPNNGPAR